MRNFVGVGAERRELHSSFDGLERVRIDFDWIEEILTALLAGEEVEDGGEEAVTADLPGIAAALDVECFGNVQTVFACLAGEHIRSSRAVENRGDLYQD